VPDPVDLDGEDLARGPPLVWLPDVPDRHAIALLDEAAPRHLALVGQLFWAPLTSDQRTQIAEVCRLLIEVRSSAPEP
jgi:hypothetical protein